MTLFALVLSVVALAMAGLNWIALRRAQRARNELIDQRRKSLGWDD